jgi:hypothetical protein
LVWLCTEKEGLRGSAQYTLLWLLNSTETKARVGEELMTSAVNIHGLAGIGAAKQMKEPVKGVRTRTQECLDVAESLAAITRRLPVVLVTKSQPRRSGRLLRRNRPVAVLTKRRESSSRQA